MNKIQIQSKEQEIERKEIRDFTDSLFHNTGFSVLTDIARLDGSIRTGIFGSLGYNTKV